VQIVGTQPITLQQSLELAQRNSEQLRIAQLQLDRQRSVLDEARAALYPTLEFNSNFTGTENSTRQSSSLTNRFAGIDPIELNWSNTLQLAYDLGISGQRSAQIRAAEAQVRFQELQVETVAEQLRLDVSSAYYDLQQADEQVRISRATLEQSLQNLRDTQALERAGVGTRFDVLSAQVDVANSQQDLNQRLSDQQTARRQLARLLIIPENVAIVAADPVRVAEPWTLSLEDSIVLAYRNRAELEQQLVQREINDQQRQVALSSIRPNISVFANYNANNQLNAGTGFNNFYQFGAQLRWSIFDGGSARAQAAQQERNIEIAESQFADNRSQVRFQVEQAYNSLQSNSANIGTTTLALSQAQEALRLARLRFQAGVGTQTDVLRSQTDLTRAEVNQVNAIIGYNRSLVQLKRAISNWPQGNLAESP
jgi:OMF family outer membrane factor